MKNPISLFKLLMALMLVNLMVACGGSSNDEPEPVEEEPVIEEPEEPEEPAAIQEPLIFGLDSGDGTITVLFTHPLALEDNPPEITYNFYYAREKMEIDLDEEGNFQDEDMSLEELQDRFDNLAGATLLEDVQSPLELTGLTNETLYYFVITATTAADGTSDPSNELRATPRDYSVLSVTPYTLNDTGITNCGDFAYSIDVDGDGNLNGSDDIRGSGRHSNQIDCVNGEVDPQGDNVPEPSAQDAYIGRDYLAQTSGLPAKTGGGLAGFDFTKLDVNGNELPENASDWSCVQDNHTGLMWEVKKTEGLHNAEDRYSWYNDDVFSNGGFEGYQRAGDLGGVLPNNTCFGFVGGNSPTYCNSAAYIDRVNGSALCGANDWRLPTRQELVGIVNYELGNVGGLSPDHLPSLDPDYFPNTQVSAPEGEVILPTDVVRYLTSDPYASSVTAVWAVYLGTGDSTRANKAQPNAIMLVREP
ncbi:MAG: DUF1566 domain-containing protein [Porticoccaceae bacterium]